MKIDGIPVLPTTGDALQRVPGVHGKIAELGAADRISGSGPDFGQAVAEAVGQVNGSQQQADQMIRRYTSGEEIDLHEVLLSVEKAELSFKAMMQVRNRLVEAYQEIMRMNV